MTLLQKNLGTAANDVHFQAYILEELYGGTAKYRLLQLTPLKAISVHLILNLD
jgi:hypothetical protein